METIKEVLMRRDDLPADEAEDLIEEAKSAIATYLEEGDIESAEGVCYEFFGLEPDYLMELL